MSEKDTAQQAPDKSGKTARIARSGLYLIPGYSVVKAVASMKETAATGMRTIVDQHRELVAQRTNPRTRTFSEALSSRSADALPLEAIERSCVRRKQLSMAIASVSVSFVLGSGLGHNYFGMFLGLLFAVFCLMFVLKFEHRLWQIEQGRASPDAPLGGYGQFFSVRGAIKRLLDPHLTR